MNETVANIIGSRIAAERREQGLSQAKLGIMADMSREYVSRIETGSTNVTVGRLYRVAEALGLPLESLFRGL